MKINDRVHLVGSGEAGFNLSNSYDCNVYLLNGISGVALIDSGAGIDPESILIQIQKDGLNPKDIDTILLTHAHADHAGGAYALSKIIDAKVYGLRDTALFLSEPDLKSISLASAIEAGIYPHDYQFQSCPVEFIKHNDILQIGDLRVQVLETPGHSDGHCCYLVEVDHKRLLFAGDLVFSGGKISQLATWDSRLDCYQKSIQFIDTLNIDCLFPGHHLFLLNRAANHIRSAVQLFSRLEVPKNYNG